MSTEKQGHERYSVKCFNDVWGLLEKEERTCEEDRLMREMAHASLFHWLSRDDVSPTNLSIGLWQVSRVHSVLGNKEAAAMYAQECITVTEDADLPAFYLGYGYEASARAASVGADDEAKGAFLEKARAELEKVADAEEKGMLASDLDELGE